MAKKTKLKITLDDGSTIKVKLLESYGCLALHEHVTDKDKITITHVPTGALVMNISIWVPLEDITAFLQRLANALADAKVGESISGEVGRKALPWIDLIRAIERAYKSIAANKPYTPIALRPPKVKRVYNYPAQQPVASIPALVAA